ncbi:AbiV family abortive infection protein [Collimonas sp. PA-H2]|uniref:AbiV family abortive infection protein n=1 Tax=Collimonas sp. PA-H2 TaxID=1881062 RepID=UPI000C00E4DA|nr:AbiV family abortive infection protein [Collimonas sp. PA-H2]PFH10964.1 AbiV family abortive infection protein [Collimonas sp. PA-H2]
MSLDPDTKNLAQTLIEGLEKTFQNADELYDEALYLTEKGAVARGLLLHQISLEECGKADMLCASVFALLRGEKIDMKRLARAFSRHEAKNKANAYFLPKSASEAEAEQNNDTAAAHVAFKEIQDRFHKESNDLKNASLYVDFDGKFIAPRDVIKSEHLADIQQRNAEFMSMTHQKVGVLTRWKTDLDAAAVELAQMWTVLGIDALDRNDPQTLQDFKGLLPAKLVELVKQRKTPSSDDA